MQVTEIQLATRKIKAYFWDSGLGVGPGIILLPDIFGVNSNLKNIANRLCREGYHVFIPDLYSGKKGAFRYCMRMVCEQASRLNEDNNALLNEVHNIVDFFKSFPYVAKNKIGMIGICLSGGFVLHMAMREEIAAPVIFHFSFGTAAEGVPIGCLKGLNKTIQGHFVHNDPFCPDSRIAALKQALENKFEVNFYKHLAHGIPYFFRLHPEGRRACINMLGFFQTHLYETTPANNAEKMQAVI